MGSSRQQLLSTCSLRRGVRHDALLRSMVKSRVRLSPSGRSSAVSSAVMGAFIAWVSGGLSVSETTSMCDERLVSTTVCRSEPRPLE